MSATGLDQVELIETEGFQTTKYLALSSFSLLIYDHFTCLNQEVEYFWNGEWNLTRILYFLNRYIPPWVFVVQILYQFKPDLSLTFCSHAIRATSAFVVIGMIIVEAVLVIRVYYLWSHNKVVQKLVLFGFIALAAVALGFAANAISALSGINLPEGFGTGCLNSGKGLYWPIFLPTFIIQTLLFLFTIFRVLGPLRSGQSNSLVKLLLRDGGYFYLVVCLSVGYTGIGSLELSHFLVSIPALLSNSLLAIHSVCASHLILSVQSLASYMGSDPVFLLSNIEMARVHWRQGPNANELVVEVNNEIDAEPDEAQQAMELRNLEYATTTEKRIILPRTVVQTQRGKGNIPSSRVGVYDEIAQTSGVDAQLDYRTYAFRNA